MALLQTLTIGGIDVQWEIADAHSCAWDLAHRAFVKDMPAVQPQAVVRVCAGTAPRAAKGEFPCLLADGRLWQLKLDPDQGRQRIVFYGCPAGSLCMTLDIDPLPESRDSPLRGTLWLGPPPVKAAPVPLGYPLTPLLWTLLLARLPDERGGLLCHACGVVTPAGDGLLFPGFSGAGKSTTSRLWREACPEALILSDDRIVLRRDSDARTGFRLYGTPWHGDACEAYPGSAPLRRLLLLGRSPDGLTSPQVPLPPALAAAQLLARTTPPIWDCAGTQAALTLAADLCSHLPAARWEFAPVPAAIHPLLSGR